MILMRFSELSPCEDHGHTIIVLEDLCGRSLAIAADTRESQRLAAEVSRHPDDEHPIYDFIDGLLRVAQLKPTRVLLVYVAGTGIRGAVAFERGEGEVAVPCYASDALALAVRIGLPIFVSASVFSDLRPTAAPVSPGEDRATLAQWLDGLKPADFATDARAATSDADDGEALRGGA